jgi:hypothetical protein
MIVNKIKRIDIWFKDESMIQITGDEATNTVSELYRYSREGVPRFFEGENNCFYNSETVDSFKLVYEGGEVE